MCRSHKQSKQQKQQEKKAEEGTRREKKARERVKKERAGKSKQKNKQKCRNGLIRQRECGTRLLIFFFSFFPFHSALSLMLTCNAAAATTTTRRPAANCCSHLPCRCALIVREFFHKRTLRKYVKAAPASAPCAPVPAAALLLSEN